MMNSQLDVAIIGGGIVGLATAMALSRKLADRLVVLEAEPTLAAHQTGHNSGVIHSGLYYRPGSLKAKTCTTGREALYTFCQEHNIPYERCGKVVVATSVDQIPQLDELERRGKANGLRNLRRIGPEEIRGYEPYVNAVAGLRVEETGIVDYIQVSRKYAELVQKSGGEIRKSSRVLACNEEDGTIILETESGTVRTRYLINCAGLESDRVARLCGARPNVRITPFRGEYYEIIPERRSLVNDLIYPVPDPEFPFLGVHFTRMIDGSVEAGPNAVLAFKREGYSKWSFSLQDTADIFLYKGFWKLAGKYWKTGIGEMYRSYSKHAFVKALQKLIPEITVDDVQPGGAGVRAQALAPDGALIDDFRIVQRPGMIHVLNAPSPAATASITIGETIARMAEEAFDL